MMLLPLLSCPARCSYCFGPHYKGPAMALGTLEAAFGWVKSLLCELFAEYHVFLGTSLDGPEEINDAQRGSGYFRRTMAGIERARRHGLNVGCICTFTPQSAPHYREIFDFFARERLDFSIHAAVPALNSDSATPLHSPAPLTCALEKPGMKANPWFLSPEAYGDLLVNLLDLYLAI